MNIAAVILNWKDPDRTMACARSLWPVFGDRRILIVDNESDGLLADTVEKAGLPGCDVLELPENRGFAGGVNAALRILSSEQHAYILVVNNDVLFERQGLEPLLNKLDGDPGVGLWAPMILNEDRSVQSLGARLNRWTGGTREQTITTGESNRSIDFLTWACVVIRAEALDAVGLLDERFFMYWEDVDIGVRLLAAGYELKVVPEGYVIHKRSASHVMAGSLIDLYSASGLVTLASKHRGQLFFGSKLRVAARVIRRLVTGDAAGALAVLMGAAFGARIRGSAYMSPVLERWNRRRGLARFLLRDQR